MSEVKTVDVGVLANRFAAIIREWLSEEELTLVNQDNHHETSVCHTHDYCDANMAMAQAWEEVAGELTHSESEMAIMNTAWDLAKLADFGNIPSFAEFQQSRRFTNNLGRELQEETLFDVSGYIYLDCLFIEQAGPELVLAIANTFESGSLEELELKLFKYAVSEGIN